MEDTKMLEAIEAAKRQFGCKCGKYSGALTVEFVRCGLESEGIRVSSRDVFIRGVPIEVDLIIPKKNAWKTEQLSYEPCDVLAAVEIKNAGSFGDSTIEMVRRNFTRIKAMNPEIRCCYLTLSERRGFRWAVTNKNCGGEAYTMFWHSGSGKKRLEESTGDWDRFLKEIKTIQERS
jgi:hypothetical protein